MESRSWTREASHMIRPEVESRSACLQGHRLFRRRLRSSLRAHRAVHVRPGHADAAAAVRSLIDIELEIVRVIGILRDTAR